MAMTDKQLLDGLGRVLVAKEEVNLAYEEEGGGVGLPFQAESNGWPFCASGTLRGVLEDLINHHAPLPPPPPVDKEKSAAAKKGWELRRYRDDSHCRRK